MSHQWYIVHAYSNFEKKVAESIRQAAAEKGLEDHFKEIFVPTEETVEVRRGRKINVEHRLFPGYVLVQMIMTDTTFHLIKEIPKVTGFLGNQTRPMPVQQAEVDRILGVIQEGVDNPRPTISFEIGESVNVIDGPFASFAGIVEGVDEEAARLKVAVSIFGRSTPVELEYNQVEKVVS